MGNDFNHKTRARILADIATVLPHVRTAMSTQALNSPTIQAGLKDILLNHASLFETLRANTAV